MRKLAVTKIITIITMLTMSLTIFATEAGSRYEDLKDKLRPQIKKMMKKNKITGLSLALVDGDETVWVEGFGYADLAKRISVDEETVFPIASITKTFTGIAIMQLVEQGLVDLDSPLTGYIPEFSIKSRFENARAITIRDLLTHHAGLPCDLLYPALEPVSSAALDRYSTFEERMLDFLAGEHLIAPPGTMHSYSNLGYDLLAVVVERVSNEKITTYMEKNIFSPLGMEASFKHIFLRNDLGNKVAHPHNQGRPAEQIILHGIGCGAANGDARAMASYIKMLLAKGSYRGEQILTEESLKEMLTVQNGDVTVDRGQEMGLSFFMDNPEFDYAGGFYGHDGGLPNYASKLMVLPEQGLGLFIATNSPVYTFGLYDTAYEILTEAVKVKSGLKPPVEVKSKPLHMTAEEAKSFEGFFVSNRFGPVELQASGRRLLLNWLEYGLKLEFKKLDNGWLRAASPIAYHRRGLMKIVTVDDRRYIYMRAPGMGHFMGVEQEKVELEPYWLERTGDYRVVEGEAAVPGYNNQLFHLNMQDGILTLNIPMQLTRMLIPLNEQECVTAGTGWASGESVYFEEKNGKTIIKWAGYTLEQTE